MSVTIKNTGKTTGSTVTQVYVAPAADAGWEAPKRLGAFAKTSLNAGESKTLSLSVDPRLLATYDSASKTWTVKGGDYKVMTGNSAADITQTTTVHIDQQTLNVQGK